MSPWTGIIDKAFIRAEIVPYIRSLQFTNWQGRFAVLHNTQAPTLAQWHENAPADPAHRILNLEHLYRDIDHWHAGPHFFVADDLIWAFTPATESGVHSPSWNEISWGIEMVGDYDREVFSDAVRDNAIEVIAALYHRFGIDANTLRLHKEDPLTTHKDCPGSHVNKGSFILQLSERLTTMG